MRATRTSIPGTFALLALLLPAGAMAQATRAGQLRYPPLPAQKIPQPERIVLDNGMVLMLLEDHELPLVDAVALVRAGSRLEPADKVGLADLAGEVLRTGGTTTMKGDQLDDFLEGKAARIESQTQEEFGRITMSSLKADFPTVLKVFADVLRHPVFDERKLQLAKNQAMAGVARQNDDPQEILFREFQKVVYGKGSPYGRTPSFATLASIQHADLVAWHQAHFHPDRIVLGLVGDFRRDEAVALVRAAFGDWPKGPPAGKEDVPIQGTASPGVFYVEKNDVTQSSVLMGGLGIVRNNPDYYALDVMNHVLSGSFASRLFANVRTQKGLAYTVFGQVGADWDHPGLTFLFMTTKTQTTAAGIEALLEEARKMTTQPPSDEEVEKARQALLNSFIFKSDAKRKILEQQLVYEYYGYPLDWLTRYRAGIEALTPAQVRAVAAKYLHPEQFAILVVGPAKGTDKPLTTFGKVTPLDVTIPPPPARQPAGR
ncbi:MAG TPA: pitrilysin family protein [Thermoanaerobaculia bacterium]|nr:pitrilysin family protein [Thermoanaerobaculia bacterium]